MLRVLVIDKTAGLEASHERHQAMAAQPEIDLHVLGPKYWVENGREIVWKPPQDCKYTPHEGLVFGKDYYARAGYYSGLCRALKRTKPDVVQLLEEPWSISAAQASFSVPFFSPNAAVVFYTWENIERGWNYPARAAALYRVIDRRLHRISSAAVCATEGARQVLLKKGYKKPVRVIPYGIPHYFFEDRVVDRDPSQLFTVGFVGRLLDMKGVDLLLQAVFHLPGCRLVLLGAGGDEAKYREYVEQHGFGDRVQWHPPVPEYEVAFFMRRFDTLVLPSRTTPGWKEQLGRVAIEAMALGVPVIGSTSGAIPEVVGDAGLLFEDGAVLDLIEKIKQMRDDRQLREQLSQAGMERAGERFTWTNFAETICPFYQEIAHS